MTAKKIKFVSVILLLMTVFVFLGDFKLFAQNRNKSTTKPKISYEQRKQQRIQKLYEYFPIFEEWEKSEIYPYNDFIFLSDFDKNSVYESFEKRKLLINRLNDWMGVRYRLPGRSRQGVDCSNFTSIIKQEVLNMQIPAGAANQATLFPKIEKIEDLQFGDLVFFTGRNRQSNRIGHVGIYIGNGLFAHSSTQRGVIYSHISEGYYAVRYRFGGRILRTDIALLSKDFRNIRWNLG